MAKLLEKPEEIKVSSNIKGMPLSLVRNGRREKIIRIYQHWQEGQRNYFTVKSSTGLACDIYHEIATKLWYLSKIHN